MNSEAPSNAEPSLWSIGTGVGWVVCLAVGVLGLLWPYPAARPPADWKEHLPTQIIDADLTPEAAPPPVAAVAVEPGPPRPEPPAPAPAPLAVPAKPRFTAVAPPSPALAFALPTEGLTRIVEVGQAGYTRTVVPRPAATGHGGSGGPAAPPPAPPPQPVAMAPPVGRLKLGEGEGRQPPPEYPREAILAQEEGTVSLRFTVGEDGRVGSVEVIAPCRWPLLNQAAARAVRETWRFNPGPGRIYEVPIEFQLNH